MSILTKRKNIKYIDDGNHYLINSPEDNVTWKNAHEHLKEVYNIKIKPVNLNDDNGDEYEIISSGNDNNCIKQNIKNSCHDQSSFISTKSFVISAKSSTNPNTIVGHERESTNQQQKTVTTTASSSIINKEIHSQVITSSKSDPCSPILNNKATTYITNIQHKSSSVKNHIADLVINHTMSNSEASVKFNLKNTTIRNFKFRRQNYGTNYEKSGRPDPIDTISDFSIKKRYSTVKFNSQDELKKDLYDVVGFEIVASKRRKQENLTHIEDKIISESNQNVNILKNIQTKLASNTKGVSNRTIKRKVDYYYNKIISNEFLFSTE